MEYRLRSLGGSGEDCRSCFLLTRPGKNILLDCGVRREIHAPLSRVYPALTEDIARSLDAVFLSHAHEDHTAALPYLHELGYRGPVYASAETLASLKGFLTKWVRFVQIGGGSLPFHTDNIDRLNLIPIGLGLQEIAGIPALLGRSGHAPGSCWICFDLNGKKLLYTGDLCCDSLLLASDPLPEAHTVVMECAYAGKVLNQAAQYERLTQSVRETLNAGGKALLPVPPNGRGIDMYLHLMNQGIPVCAERPVLEAIGALRNMSGWIMDSPLWDAADQPGVSPKDEAERDTLVNAPKPMAFFTPDGMLTAPVALRYYECLKHNPSNKIIISGHAAEGTVGASIFSESFRRENAVLAQAERITVKVHPDETDALRLLKNCAAQQVMLFHAPAESCGKLTERLRAQGIACVVGTQKDCFLTI